MRVLSKIDRVMHVLSVHRSHSRDVGCGRTRSRRRVGIGVVAGLALTLSPGLAALGLAQTVDRTFCATNGDVASIVVDGGRIYLGGSFTRVGSFGTGGGNFVDASTGTPLAPDASVAGAVYAVAPDGSGGWYLGGAFTAVREVPRISLAHLDASGNLTDWNPQLAGLPGQISGVVNALAVDENIVYIGGRFTSVGGQPRNCIAAVDAVSGAVASWNPDANRGSDGPSWVSALAVKGSMVYVGGFFTQIGGAEHHNIGAVDKASGLATAWPLGADAPVKALLVSGNTVYAAGTFTSIGGQARNLIAALDASDGAALGWNANVEGSGGIGVAALALEGATLYAGGEFYSVGGQLRNGLAAIDVASGAVSSWNPNPSNPSGPRAVTALAVSGSTVYVGGAFTTVGGQTREHIAAIDAASGAATAWDPGPNGTVYVLAVRGGAVFAGGEFTLIGGQRRNNIAALDAASGALTAWNPNADKGVATLAVSGGTVYAGGLFTSIGGQARNLIAALDAASGAATAWNPTASGPSGYVQPAVYALAVSGSTVYVGGYFSAIGGDSRNNIAALDATTGAATPFNPNASGPLPAGYVPGVYALVVNGGTVYAGGLFASIGGQPRRGLAALNAASGAAMAWNPNVAGAVTVLALEGSTLYVGGSFPQVGSQPRESLAAIDVASGTPTAWNPGEPAPSNSSVVHDLLVNGDVVYVGGEFSRMGGQPRYRIAAVDAASGLATPWDPNADPNANPFAGGYVFALAMQGPLVYAGGSFTRFGNMARPYLVAINTEPPTAAVLVQFDATTTADGIELRWMFGDASGVTSVAVERAVGAAGPWLSIAPERHDASGIAVALDRSADGSGEYYYRLLAQLGDGTQMTFGPVSARGREPLSRSELTLVSPNPTPRGARVQYAVARAGRVRLELLDVAGRVEATLADRIHEPGRYAASWDGASPRGRLSPGLHFVRLVAPDRVTVRKLAMTP